MLGSGKKIYNSRAQQNVVEYNLSECIREKANMHRAKTKIQYKNSPQSIISQNGRNITQQLDLSKKKVVADLTEAVKQTSQNVFKLIVKELGIVNKAIKANNYMQPEVSFEQIEETINVCLPALKELRAICFNDEILTYNRFLYSNFKKLFDGLIELDLRFALFAPKISLKDKMVGVDLKIELLPEDFQNKIKLLKEKLELDEDLDYVSTAEITEPKVKDERVEKIQSMSDFLKESVFNAKLEIVNSTKNLSSNLYAFIIEQLHLQDFDQELHNEDIEKVLSICRQGLNALKLSSARSDLNEVGGWKELDPYTELFNRLMNINIKFAFFAPKKSLNRLDIDFKRLSEQDRNKVQRVILNYGLWDDDEFFENYKDLFNIKKTIEHTI